MKNLQLQIRKENIVSLNGQIAYCLEALSQSDIQEWEKREYEGVISDCKLDILRNQSIINDIKNLIAA